MAASTSSAADAVVTSTRERILSEALGLFAQSGYGGASMRELARRVGIRESSLYNHFPGKAAILEAIVSEHGPASSADRLEAPRYRQLARQPAAFCRQFALDLVEQWSDPREHQFQKVITAERNRVPGIRAKFADHFYTREQNLMTDYFRGFALAGLISTTDPREAARLFAAGLIYVRLEHYVMGAQASPRPKVIEAIERYLAFFLSLIAAKDADISDKKQRKKGETRGKAASD
ncbi:MULTISPECIES: TetR/AcrR family transcriptional regulator [unclassified Bradyrhizobium]|uniref:TetR/AcrR family transcriptional regulator n=1 Tax=unclassified Bradyrhizobium TaxID=2631580 RepID=UPI001BA475B6|nr:MULTISPECIES: TetR/AcrR family transcriptional regulator [unclassified Bradyrhizobium]MBR1202475.1 TetR/AcrR family transcriptional regulator [Bradyrhizobium sp. AUGA SZCCT0124]MBR1310956.1 TetR/AcrR family transcriptional regulator [Bradyrhizobium sp. AUGA SZCCT0051]MBR1339424.1 TetR/AcrR family transcriptional regulator [Bradyrhizobium sp. AUGA SZCCT0105]MBR1353998.1 TetR/AcrR family transcriptional regulator [Bradyrhizobium sp. AUGA SZCCT0045]